MARRFGGKYSPGGAQPQATARSDWRGKRPMRMGGRANGLFFLALPFAFLAFLAGPVGLFQGFAAFALLALAAAFTREGLNAQDAYDARRVARRPAFPRKMFGSVLMGAGLALGGFSTFANLAEPIIYGFLGAVLHFLAFGADPMKDKGLEGTDSFHTDRVSRAVDEAEQHLAAMSEAIRPLSDRALMTRVEGFQQNARSLFRAVEDDPRTLTAARRYLGVYLLGARDATRKFADLYARRRDVAARTDYEALLTDLEANFAHRTEALLASDRNALDIEMEVLRERLAREGLRPEEEAELLPEPQAARKT